MRAAERSSGVLGFEGRVALVTGAGSGLGLAHARLLASRGAAVVVADLPAANDRPGAAVRAAEMINDAGGEAQAVEASVADSDGGRRLVAAAVDRFGRLDILINNAGIVRDSSFAKLDDDALDAVIRVHLLGAFNVARPAWHQM